MEDALVPATLAKGAFGSASLNPCFNGRCTSTGINIPEINCFDVS